jgi:hypothetical protein
MAEIYERVVKEAEQQDWGYRKFLLHLCEAEGRDRAERLDGAIAVVAAGVAQVFNRDWTQARMAFTMFGQEFKDADSLRIDAHLHAVDTLQQLRRDPRFRFGSEDNAGAVVLEYLGLKDFGPQPVLFDGRCPPEFLACAFAGHVSRCEGSRG